MRQRCADLDDPNYGGRGIRVCDRWQDSFENFFADVGPRPGPGFSIDRFPDNDGNYEPGNVRWATVTEQQNNRRKTRRVTAFGQTMAMTDWARLMKIPVDTLWRRLSIWNWSPEHAVSTPVPPKKTELRARVIAAGYETVSAFMKATGVHPSTLYRFANEPHRLRAEVRDRIESLLVVIS
jgi:hypothetical protein